MRLFIAVDLPQETKSNIAQIITKLEQCEVGAKWVKPQNLHFTLKFLGEVEEKKIDAIKHCLNEVAQQHQHCTVSLTGFGFFPEKGRPRVFFVSTDHEQFLGELSRSVEDALLSIGFPKEGRFKSHITLARIKIPRNIDQLKRTMASISLKQSFPVKEITLFKSTLKPTGPIYEIIHRAPLTTK